MNPTSLSQFYGGNLITPTQTVAERFALPGFADAAKTAGYDQNTYTINSGNADANNKILAALVAAKAAGAGATGATPSGGTGTGTSKTDTPVGTAYKLPGDNTNPDQKTADDAYLAYINGLSKGDSGVDEATIRANTLKEFGAEIDATNALFAQKLAEAKVAGQGRIGSNTAVQARRGMLGSDFGAAQTDTITSGNNDIYAGIEAERKAAVSAIIDKSKAEATKIIADKTAAMEKGLDARVQYYKDAETRKATNATNAATFIYNQGLGLSDLTPDQLKTTATNYGISVDDLTKAYSTVKTAGDQQKIKNAKDSEVSVGAGNDVYMLQPDGSLKKVASGTNSQIQKLGKGQTLYQLDPKTGQYVPVAQGAPTGTGTGTGTGGATVSKDQIAKIKAGMEALKGPDKYIDPYQYVAEYNDWVNVYKQSADSFLKNFPPKQYVNPKAADIKNTDGTYLLPDYLLPGARPKKTTSGRAG